MIYFSTQGTRTVTLSSVNYSPEGIFHPDRIMAEYDFLYMQSGSWDIWEDESCYHIEKGQLLILEPGRRHYSLEKCSPHMRNMYVHCTALPGDRTDVQNSKHTPDRAVTAVPDALYMPDQTEPSDGLYIRKVTDCTQNPQIEQLFLQMIETLWSRPAHADFRLSSLLNVLLTELAVSEGGTPQTDSVVKDIIHQFCCDTSRFFTPQELADQYRISVRSLSGRFKKAMGISIHQYQLSLKLNLAHEQLRLYPNRGLRDIALSLGFYDEFHFSRLFKRQFGYPPSYRK